MTDLRRGFSAKFVFFTILVISILFIPNICSAQEDNRAQYPGWLLNSYAGINFGHIDYQFSGDQLESGYRVGSVIAPGPAVQLALGHNFNDYLSAQVAYARPVNWVKYRDVSGSGDTNSNHSVFTNTLALSVRGTIPLRDRISAYGEGGLGIMTRSGFEIDDRHVLKDAHYPAILVGGGLKYRLNRTWDLQVSVIYLPPEKRFRQPRTLMTYGGGVFNIRPVPSEKVKVNARSGKLFPENLLQIGFTTNGLGTSLNRLVSGKVPIFWGGDAKVKSGGMMVYQRNLFHTKKLFSLDAGVSGSFFKDVENGKNFATVSIFPQFKFTPVRSGLVDFYFTYSIGGPTYISRTFIDGIDTGSHFTFQDLMGFGGYIGSQKKINAEVRIGHYSSGNIFPRNPGIQIPLTFNLGYVF